MSDNTMRTLIAMLCYIAALAFIWLGMSTPNAEARVDAMSIVTLGCVLKLVGHWFLLSTTRAR